MENLAAASKDNRITWIENVVINTLYFDASQMGEKSFNFCLEENSQILLRFLNAESFKALFFCRKGDGDNEELFMCSDENVPDNFDQLDLIYLTRTSDRSPIPESASIQELPKFFEWGFIHGNTLKSLEMSVDLFSGVVSTAKLDKDFQEIPDEVFNNLKKFDGQVKQSLLQLTSAVKLDVPEVDFDFSSPKVPPLILKQCTDLSATWLDVIFDYISNVIGKKAANNSPASEIEYWNDRSIALSPLYEQLKDPKFLKICKILETADSVTSFSLKRQVFEVNHYYMEAKDNVKFLRTLERHFKTLSSGPISKIKNQMPSLFDNLKMIWIVSRFYNTDERMVPLMSKIASQLCNRVTACVNVKTIFEFPSSESTKLLRESKDMLEIWSKTYFEIRANLEQSGRDQRWEFDRKKLFERSNYMANRCGDLLNIVQVLDQFFCVFGSDMKAVTGDTHGVDDLRKRVHALVSPIEQAPFDVFDRKYQNAWDSLFARFEDQIVHIEDISQQYIDASFQKLKSAQGALELLQNLRSVKTREVIHEKMMSKFTDILMQYGKEVDSIREIFESCKNDPPISRFQPPVAGSVAWCRLLFQRVKTSLIRFKDFPDLLNSADGKIVGKKYIALAKLMKDYEERKYTSWIKYSESNTLTLLKQPILTVTGVGENEEPALNFPQELSLIIKEAKNFDKLGYALPEVVLNVALQDEKYQKLTMSISNMLQQYQELIDSLNESEKKLLFYNIQKLKKTLLPGYTRINWTSLGAYDFLAICHREIGKMKNLLTQVRKSSDGITSIIRKISEASLIPKDILLKVSDINEFVDIIKQNMTKVLDDLVSKYISVPQLLIKIESMVFNKNSAKCPKMKAYYTFWEWEIFEAITKMIHRNLCHLYLLCSKDDTENPRAFSLVSALKSSEALTSATVSDNYTMVVILIKSILESSKLFFRWQFGSCILTVPQVVSIDEDPVSFTFYSDVSVHPDINTIAQQLSSIIKTLRRNK